MGKRAFDPDRVRVVALIGHRASGKTTLGDDLLHLAGVTRVPGRVAERSSLFDHHPRERARGASLCLGHAWLEWGEALVSLVDVPGSPALAHERAVALAASDGAVLVVGAHDGLGVGGEDALREARRAKRPLIAVITQADRGVDLDAVCAQITAVGVGRAVPIQEVLRDHRGEYCGSVTLPAGPAWRYADDASGARSEEPLSRADAEAAGLAWERLTEAVAATDDHLLEAYLEYLELSADQVWEGLSAATARGELIPVLVVDGLGQRGGHAVLDAIVRLLPSAEVQARAVPSGAFAARVLGAYLDEEGQPYTVVRVISGAAAPNQVWRAGAGEANRVRKLYQVRGPRRAVASWLGPGAVLATWEPVDARPGEVVSERGELSLPWAGPPPAMVARAVSARDKKSADGLPAALDLLRRIDAAVVVEQSALTGQPVLRGHSDAHLAHLGDLLKHDLNLQVSLQPAPVDYREIPAIAVHGAHGVHLRKSADEVQEFGECWVDLAPLDDPDAGLAFEATVEDEVLPRKFHHAIRDGVAQGLHHGPTAGYPVTGVQVRCVGGEYDIFMSTDEHFRLAGERAVRHALEQAGSRLLEPWSNIELEAPPQQVGEVLGELAAHRGQVHGVDVDGASARIVAEVPDRELRTFAARLQALTSGRGRFAAAHSRYGLLPTSLQAEAVAESPFRARARGAR